MNYICSIAKEGKCNPNECSRYTGKCSEMHSIPHKHRGPGSGCEKTPECVMYGEDFFKNKDFEI